MSTAENTPGLDTPFWAFSLAVYAGDGVAEECLGLQERFKFDVNLLLFVAFAGAAEGVVLARHDIALAFMATANWHGEVVRTLRTARRELKASSADAGNPFREASATLRLQVKAAELEAEKIEQGMLWQWSQRELAERPRANRGEALAINLRHLFEFYELRGSLAATSAPRLTKAAAAYAAAR